MQCQEKKEKEEEDVKRQKYAASFRRMESDAVRDIFRSFFHSLVLAIEPEYLDVSKKLYADGWIGKMRIDMAGVSSQLVATHIVSEVETQLK